MNWIFIALMSGMLVTSQHKDEEGCLGRKAIFEKEHKALSGKCIDLSIGITFGSNAYQSKCYTQGTSTICGER